LPFDPNPIFGQGTWKPVSSFWELQSRSRNCSGAAGSIWMSGLFWRSSGPENMTVIGHIDKVDVVELCDSWSCLDAILLTAADMI
jgi:hypothetical protein